MEAISDQQQPWRRRRRRIIRHAERFTERLRIVVERVEERLRVPQDGARDATRLSGSHSTGSRTVDASTSRPALCASTLVDEIEDTMIVLDDHNGLAASKPEHLLLLLGRTLLLLLLECLCHLLATHHLEAWVVWAGRSRPTRTPWRTAVTRRREVVTVPPAHESARRLVDASVLAMDLPAASFDQIYQLILVQRVVRAGEVEAHPLEAGGRAIGHGHFSRIGRWDWSAPAVALRPRSPIDVFGALSRVTLCVRRGTAAAIAPAITAATIDSLH